MPWKEMEDSLSFTKDVVEHFYISVSSNFFLLYRVILKNSPDKDALSKIHLLFFPLYWFGQTKKVK
jgi:hypothetical protein